MLLQNIPCTLLLDCGLIESMYLLIYSGIVSLFSFILKNQSETYFVLVLILLALVAYLCWHIWLGKTTRENELAQQQQGVLAHMEERMLFSSRLEAQLLNYERQVDENRRMIKEVYCKNKEVEQIRDAKKEFERSYEQLKGSLSECEAKNCTLNEVLKKESCELEIKSKDLEEAYIRLKETQSMLERKQKNMARMQEDLKQHQKELARERDEKQSLEETVQNVSEELNRHKDELQ